MFVQLIKLFVLIFAMLVSRNWSIAKADVIMADGNGAPSIIEDDDFQDVILVPGMSNMLINEDLVL